MADLVITNTDVLGGKGVAALAGEALLAGEVVYLDTAGAALKAANTSALVAAVAGIALNDAELNQPVGILKTGVLTASSVFTKGDVYVVSAAGKISAILDHASGDFLTILGWGLTATTLQLSLGISGIAK